MNTVQREETPFCPIPSLNDVRTRVFVNIPGDQTVESAFGVHTGDVRIFECPVSGLRFRQAPDRDTLESFYGQDYHEFYGASPAGEPAHPDAPLREYAARVDFLRKVRDGGKVLDVGCSTGLLAKRLLESGFDAYGCDISKDACEVAGKSIGSDRVFCGTLDEVADALEQGSFDAVTLMDVLEHFDDIVTPLRTIRGLLKPDGVLFLPVPVLSSPFFRIADFSYKLTGGSYKKAVRAIYHAEHLYYFTERSLQTLLEDTGFRIAKSRRDPLLWKTFSTAELVHGPVINTVLASVYWASRLLGGGHGLMVIAEKHNG